MIKEPSGELRRNLRAQMGSVIDRYARFERHLVDAYEEQDPIVLRANDIGLELRRLEADLAVET